MKKLPNGPWPAAPPLLTLDHGGSWVNRAGRVDRSACIEIRASELRTLAAFHKPARTMVDSGRAVTGSYRESAAEVTVTAHQLWMLHRKRLPRQLQGDHRTTKSNAMNPRNPPHPRESKERRRRKRAGFCEPGPNPNRGAAATKMLGLWYEWSQTVRIERWRLHARLAQHFLICDGEPHRESNEGAHDSRCLKLFMVMCTPQESADADLAELWVRQVNAISERVLRGPMPPEVAGMRARLIERYGVLFRGRKLLCRRCLGIRYGETKKKKEIHRRDAEDTEQRRTGGRKDKRVEVKTAERGDRGDRGKADRGKEDRGGLDTLEYLARIEKWMRSTKKLNDELLSASSDADDQAALAAAERLLVRVKPRRPGK